MEDGEKKVSVSALKAIKERRSIRKFKSGPISEMDLHTILEAGIAAPSSKNRQPWHFTVVRGDAKEELARVMERGLNLGVKAHEPFLPESMKFINGAFNSVNVLREAPVVVMVSNELGKGIDFAGNLSVDERVAEICNVQSVAAAVETCCWLPRNWASAVCGSVISSLPIRKFPNGWKRKTRITACWWQPLLSVTRMKCLKPVPVKASTTWLRF